MEINGKKRKSATCEMKKIPLKEYFDGLTKVQKTQFVSNVASMCGVSHRTVERWVVGDTSPRLLEAQEIARIANMSPEKLFPEMF